MVQPSFVMHWAENIPRAHFDAAGDKGSVLQDLHPDEGTKPLSTKCSPFAHTFSVREVVSLPGCVLPYKYRKLLRAVVQTDEGVLA